jgi:dimethylargininase
VSARIAITREVTAAIAHCELTHFDRSPIDAEKVREQHSAYERALSELGCEIVRLPSDPDLADAVFVEDTAVVLDELAIVTRPGAESRRAETGTVARALARYRQTVHVQAPGTLDGGDVLVIGRRIFIGVSSRTNVPAIEQVQQHASPFGYEVEPVRVSGCLHLKSAVTAVDDRTLLINPAWVPPDVFEEYEAVSIDPREPYAANVVRVGEALVYPASFPRTLGLLEQRGFRVRVIDVSELQKAEGAVTCCSLIFSRKVPQ